MFVRRKRSFGDTFNIALNPFDLSHTDDDSIDAALKQREAQHQIRRDLAQRLVSAVSTCYCRSNYVVQFPSTSEWRGGDRFPPDRLAGRKQGSSLGRYDIERLNRESERVVVSK